MKILDLLAKRAHKILSSPLLDKEHIPFITEQINFCINCCIRKTGLYQVTPEYKSYLLSRKIESLNKKLEEAKTKGEESLVMRLLGVIFLLQNLSGSNHYLDLCDANC